MKKADEPGFSFKLSTYNQIMSSNQEPPTETLMDETDLNLRAYLEGLSDDHLSKYDRSWTDEEVKQWDTNFRSDGALMLVCCERDVEVVEFREVLEEHLSKRGLKMQDT